MTHVLHTYSMMFLLPNSIIKMEDTDRTVRCNIREGGRYIETFRVYESKMKSNKNTFNLTRKKRTINKIRQCWCCLVVGRIYIHCNSNNNDNNNNNIIATKQNQRLTHHRASESSCRTEENQPTNSGSFEIYWFVRATSVLSIISSASIVSLKHYYIVLYSLSPPRILLHFEGYNGNVKLTYIQTCVYFVYECCIISLYIYIRWVV